MITLGKSIIIQPYRSTVKRVSMILLTQQEKEQISKTYPLYSQDGMAENAICIAKFFIGSWTWYILEGNFENGDFIMFGIVINGVGDEYGYVSLRELEGTNVRGFQVERDLYFEKCPLKNISDEQLQAFLTSIYSKAV